MGFLKAKKPDVPKPTPAPVEDSEQQRRYGLRAIADLQNRAADTRLTSRLGDSEDPEKRVTTLGGRAV